LAQIILDCDSKMLALSQVPSCGVAKPCAVKGLVRFGSLSRHVAEEASVESALKVACL
jgi:hypothetical protein